MTFISKIAEDGFELTTFILASIAIVWGGYYAITIPQSNRDTEQ